MIRSDFLANAMRISICEIDEDKCLLFVSLFNELNSI
jgi:hypothetical protein